MTLALDIAGVDFDGHRCLGPLVLQIDRGAFVGIVGPNGAGKTTLLRVCAGLVEASAGTVCLGGRSYVELGATGLASHVAYVPQQGRTDFPFRVLEMVMLGARASAVNRIWDSEVDRSKADQLLVDVGLGGLRERYIDTLSGGEYQRMLIARALMQETQTILLDEPTAALDLGHQLEVLRLMRRYHEQGITLICALHDLNLAAMFCQRVILLFAGRIAADGAPEAVFTAERLSSVYGEQIEIGRRKDGTLYVLPSLTPISSSAEVV